MLNRQRLLRLLFVVTLLLECSVAHVVFASKKVSLRYNATTLVTSSEQGEGAIDWVAKSPDKAGQPCTARLSVGRTTNLLKKAVLPAMSWEKSRG